MGLEQNIEFYKEMHKDPDLYQGSTLNIHGPLIQQMYLEHKPEELLDYGCGKGDQYFKEKRHKQFFQNLRPWLYDPAVKGFDVLPSQNFDGVFCTDVLEHIEEADVQQVLEEIFSKAIKFVYLGICTIPANSFLPDGRNSHVTIKPLGWWTAKVAELSPSIHTMIYCYGKTKGFSIFRDGKVTTKER